MISPTPPGRARVSGQFRAAEAEGAYPGEDAAPPPGAYGLYGLRDLPPLGRLTERREIWSAVVDAVRDRRPTVVLLEGPMGVGKSRLARDAAERSAELGLSIVLQTSWSAAGSGDEGLRGLLENLFDTRGATRERVRARLEFWLERLPGLHGGYARDVELLLRPLPRAAPDEGLPLRVAVETVARAAQLRPVLLWLDDVQWARGQAEALVDALVAREGDLPVCVVATARAEELGGGAGWETRARRVRMDRLDGAATRQLVRGLLEIDDDLTDFLTARAEGNPLFASQLLRQLVDAGSLERKEGRYRLTSAFDLSTVPADIGALWERRLAQSGAGRRELAALALVRDRPSLEIAAELARILGPSVERAIERALAGDLLRAEGKAYAWAHGLLRDHLIQSIPADEARRLHDVGAAALLPLAGHEDVQEERARHLRAAGRPRDACEAMLDAMLWSQRRADAGPRRERGDALVAWAREAGFVDLEARGRAELAYLDVETGFGERAEQGIAAARELVRDERVAAWVALRAAMVARLRGRTGDGGTASEEALRLARKAGVPEVEILALLQLGLDQARQQNLARGRALLEEAAERSRGTGDRAGEAQAVYILGSLEDPGPRALELVARGVELAQAAGAHRLELMARKVLIGELWRVGEHERARGEARELREEAARRSLRQVVSLISLEGAAWSVSTGDWQDANAQRDFALRWGAETGATVERAQLYAVEIALALARGDADAAQRFADRLDEERGGYADWTLRATLEAAARLAPPQLRERLQRI